MCIAIGDNGLALQAVGEFHRGVRLGELKQKHGCGRDGQELIHLKMMGTSQRNPLFSMEVPVPYETSGVCVM